MTISQQKLNCIKITKLKQLENLECSFDTDKNITAILGVNGCGKSTLLHALACCFKPCNGKGEDHRFKDFFLPSNYNTWQGSEFSITYSFRENTTEKPEQTKKYQKSSDRWTRYESRPERPVYYIGINTCVPDVEITTKKSGIKIVNIKQNAVLNGIIDTISYILNEKYSQCATGTSNNKQYRIVKRCGLEYPSISMGAGEQRLFKILERVYSAPKYSLILIDELDLTLHTSALNRLLDKLIEWSDKNHIQIIFTTHRENVTQRTDINIKHFYQVNEKTFCFNGVNNACIEAITGKPEKKIQVFTEDLFSTAIIQTIAKDLRILSYCNINTFGAIDNGFTVASAIAATNRSDCGNNLIVLDGDNYTTEDEKKKQLESKFSGNTEYENGIRERAIKLIKEYKSDDKKSPDTFVVELIKNDPGDSEIHSIIKGNMFTDNHDYAKKVAENLGINICAAYTEMISLVKDKTEWQSIVAPIKEWLQAKKEELALSIEPAMTAEPTEAISPAS